MIPLRDLQERSGFPFVTAVLVLMNTAVWIYVLTLLDRPSLLLEFFDRWSAHPVAQIAALERSGPSADALAPLFTYQFLHAGWLHIAGNMVFLWVFGAAVETRLGPLIYLVFYLVAGCAACLAQGLYEVAVGGSASLVGASGAISGVLGAYIVLAPTARVRALVTIGLFTTLMTLPAVLVLGEWFVVQVIAAIDLLRVVDASTAGVAYFAHLGGFAFGAAVFGLARLGSLTTPRPSHPRPPSA